MSTEEAVNPQQLARQLEKEQRKAKAAVEMEERQKEKEAKKQRNLELARVAQEAKLKKKQERAETMALLEQELTKKREQSRIVKEANMEKMREQQEAKKAKDQERMVKHEAQQKVEEENARVRAETTVLVSLDQQALLDQIRLVAEKSGAGSKVAKLTLVSVGNTSQVKLVFENAAQAKSFLASKPEKNDLLVKMENARPLAGAKRTCYFSFDFEPHGDRNTAQAAVLAALKKGKMKFSHGVLKGAIFVVEFASEQDTDKGFKALSKETYFLGAGKTRCPFGADAVIGNPPRRPNKKRTHSSMQE